MNCRARANSLSWSLISSLTHIRPNPIPMPFNFLPYIKTHHPRTYTALKNLRSFLSTLLMGNNSSNSSAGVAADPPPPPFDPLKPAVPISYPLQTLEELESRAYFKSFHYPFNKAAVKLPAGELPKRRRNLVCHDMAGGYTDDKLVQGGAKEGAFAIWHWHLIDVFVYFSHNLVTLPPPCWTNAAHKHGVKVLGTFIMEWDEGKQRADKLLASKDSVRMYADRLTELAVALGFDGWLINMEVTLDPGQIPNLKEFISYFSQTMHSSLPGSLVIWYDSVTIDGHLSWQNKLNDKNKPFFDLCDGIFVNYSWLEDYPKQSANVAGDRKFDVYMGIDIFGRGTYGGGQWTTNVALDVIKKDEVSTAIFAPGWVYETEQPPDFQTAQNRWWGLVEQSWGIVQKYPKVLPFYSNFDQGHGYHIYSDGMQISSNQWNNISSQSFQPFLKYSGDSKAEPIQVSMEFKGASYNGGGSISFIGTLVDGAEFTTRLFHGELPLGNASLYFTYSVKLSGNSLLGLALGFSSPTNEKKSILLAGSGDTLLTMNRFSSRFSNVIMPRQVTKSEQEPGWIIQKSSINMAGHVLTEIRALCYRAKPEKSAAVDADATHPQAPSEYYAVLGDLKITIDGENTKFPPSNSWNVDSEFLTWSSSESKKLSVKIIWQLKDGNVDIFPKYNIFVEKLNSSWSWSGSRVVEVAKEYLGEAVVESFYVSDLEVPKGTSSLKFIIQVYGLDGASQKLEDSPFLQVKVDG